MATLQSGSSGPDVTALQDQLIQLGYQVIADGSFGPNTRAAVIQFQTAHGLTTDGMVGPNTLAAIAGALPVTASVGNVKGIDISHNNGTVNWATIGSQVSFVYCKATQGSSFKDPMLAANMANAAGAGLMRGAYHFLTFQNATAQQQIDNFLSCGIDFSAPGILPPVLDIEWQVPDTLNPYILTNRAACIQLISDWLTGIQSQTGRTPMIYTNTNFWGQYLNNPPGFSNYPLWISGYQATPPRLPAGWNNYTIWQNSGSGTVPGVQGQVDTDIFNGTSAQLQAFANIQTA